MTAPLLAVGNGALVSWEAVREVFRTTKEQRCWFHKQTKCICHVAQVSAVGATFHKGKLLERPTDITPPEPAHTAAGASGSEAA